MSNQAKNAALGESSVTPASADTREVLAPLEWLIGKHKGPAQAALTGLLANATAAVDAGVDPLLIAEALAGGDEVAAGRLFDLRAGEDFPEGGTYDNVMDEVLRTVRPKVRQVAIWSAVSHLTDDDLVSLVRSWAARSGDKLAKHGLVVTDLSAGVDIAEVRAAFRATKLDMDEAARFVRRLGNHRKRELAERGLVIFGVPAGGRKASYMLPLAPSWIDACESFEQFQELPEAEKRELTDFVLWAAVQAGTVTQTEAPAE